MNKVNVKISEFIFKSIAKSAIFYFLIGSLLLSYVLFLMPNILLAYHPLITDDTGTQGKGGLQLELNGEYDYDKENGITINFYNAAAALTYGLIDSMDLIIGVPYQFIQSRQGSETTKDMGISDTTFQAKWKFYEINKFSFAFKPGISAPTGNYKKGFGSGKVDYSGYLINTIDMETYALHINAGYIRNENKIGEPRNLWYVSAAFEYNILKNIKIVTDLGTEKNPDPYSDKVNLKYILGGIIYSFNNNLDLDAGLKYGFTNSESEYSVLAGLTIKF